MLGKRIINATSGVACTTDTVQILDGVPFDSIATYELESDASNSVDTGYIGKSAIFSGSSSYISTSLSSSGINAMSFWLYFESGTTQYTPFGTDVGSGAGNLVTELGTNGSFSITIQNKTYAAGAGALGSTGWKHIAYSSNQELYINGVLHTGGTTSTSSNPSANLLMGGWRYPVPSWGAFNSKIDQLRVYNTALTAGNVATLYAETASSTISISGLLAYYKFEGNATDETGNYDGTATNITYNEYDGTATNVTYATGKFGNAAVFNGSSSFVQIDSIPTNNIFSLSFWVNANDPNSDNDLFHFYDSTNHIAANNIGIANAGTQFGWFPHTSTGGAGFTGISAADTNALFDGSWHHVVIASDANSFANTKIYIDGNEKTLTISNSYTTSVRMEGTLYIGKRQDGYGDFNGKLDQVRIYDQKLSAANVAELYAETLATSQTNPLFNAPSGVAYYKMNDATDETGSYDGTATNVNFNVAGKFGNAGEFNGSSSKIQLPQTYGAEGETFSYSFWFNTSTNAANNDDEYMISKRNGNNTFHIRIETNGTIALNNWGGSAGSAYNVFSTNSYTDGNWHHFVFTYDGNSATKSICYIDGSRDASMDWTYDLLTQSISNGNVIGQIDLGGRAYTGKLDQVRIFDRAITANEVEKLYNEVQCIPTIVPTDHFEPVIYTGNEGTKEISDLDFAPDLVWIKHRNQPYTHALHDSVRGVRKLLRSNETSAEYNTTNTPAGTLTSFDDDGFTVIEDATWTLNDSSTDYISWNWKAGGAAVSNTDGTITSQVSANVDAGFSIVSYAGNSATSATIGHGLDSAPEMVIIKARNFAAGWPTLGVPGGNFTYCRRLNDTAVDNPSGYYSVFFNSTLPTSSVFSVGNSDEVNDGYNYIAYAFHSVDGYSKIGSYIGTGTVGNSIVTGFRPAYLMVKRTDSGDNWLVFDNKRNTTNPTNLSLIPNSSAAESVGNLGNGFNFLSNGFQVVSTDTGVNANGGSYIFMAFAEEVFVPEIPFEGGDFNGLEYQLVTNPTTGRTWLDRNLGATRVATSSTDSAAFGYYYQWGRLSDGHQIPTSSTTSTLSGSDVPGNSNFITSTVSPKDWRSPQNPSLWQGPQSYNNPCPPGFRLPTEAEILEEAASWGSQNSAGAFASNLKLPTGSGIRIETGGAPVDTGAGYIWTSTISGTDAKFYYVAGGGDFTSNYRRAAGCPVRPIKDE